MREGAELMVRRKNQHSVDDLIDQLDACCNKYSMAKGLRIVWGCCYCPDLNPCVRNFDTRIDQTEIKCKECGKVVVDLVICSNCGARLKRTIKKGRPKGIRKRLKKH